MSPSALILDSHSVKRWLDPQPALDAVEYIKRTSNEQRDYAVLSLVREVIAFTVGYYDQTDRPVKRSFVTQRWHSRALKLGLSVDLLLFDDKLFRSRVTTRGGTLYWSVDSLMEVFGDDSIAWREFMDAYVKILDEEFVERARRLALRRRQDKLSRLR